MLPLPPASATLGCSGYGGGSGGNQCGDYDEGSGGHGSRGCGAVNFLPFTCWFYLVQY